MADVCAYCGVEDPQTIAAIFTDILRLFARVLAIQGGKGRSIDSESDPADGSAACARGTAPVRPPFSRRPPLGARVREVHRRNGGQRPVLCGRVEGRARLAGRRSVGLHACSARGGRA